MEWLVIGVLGIVAIVVAAQAATRVRVAAPLLLVVIGIAVSLLPFVPAVEIEPEWILAGVLPPLLYSAAVSMPTMDFRRDFTAISGLSVILVVLSSVALGVLFSLLIPGLGLAAGIALGAIVSPTDAVATNVVKRLGVSPRIVAVLEGESLLNDATALVLLRSAIVATAATVSFWGVIGDFAYAVAVAVVIGLVVGWLNLRVRTKVSDPAVNTAISFTIPFIASIPAEQLGASGLVAAVTAGLVTGRGAARWLTPANRLSDTQNWRTIELLLEGAVFLVMGLELSAILADVQADHAGIWVAFGIAALAVVAILVVRAAYVAPLLWGLARSARVAEARGQGLASMQKRIDNMAVADSTPDALSTTRKRRARERTLRPKDAERFRQRAGRYLADVEYMKAEPLGVREGAVVVWAGMRGVVTLAAAQTLPADTPSRSLLVLIAFFVAAISLVLQGGTIGPVARRLGLTGHRVNSEERRRLSGELQTSAMAVLDAAGIDLRALAARAAVRPDRGDRPTDGADGQAEDGDGIDLAKADEAMLRSRDIRLEIITAQRARLLELQKSGTYSSGSLRWALGVLDADEIGMRLRSPDLDED